MWQLQNLDIRPRNSFVEIQTVYVTSFPGSRSPPGISPPGISTPEADLEADQTAQESIPLEMKMDMNIR
jgi:hypothetical protein